MKMETLARGAVLDDMTFITTSLVAVLDDMVAGEFE